MNEARGIDEALELASRSCFLAMLGCLIGLTAFAVLSLACQFIAWLFSRPDKLASYRADIALLVQNGHSQNSLASMTVAQVHLWAEHIRDREKSRQ